jgi:hypothetical protein
LFALIVSNFIFWGTLGNILLLNDFLNDTDKTKLIYGKLIEVNKVGDKGEHYEALVLIDSDTAQFAINKETFELFQKKNVFHETMKKGYLGILYK